MASTISFEALTAELMALSPKDQGKLFSAVLLSNAGKAKVTKAAKRAEKLEKDPDAPKRPANNYITFTNTYVWPVLKAHAETLDEDDKKALRHVSARTQISADLYAPIKALDASEQEAAMEAVTEKSILAAYASWKKSPPAPHCKADKEAKASSVASGGSKSAKSAKAKPVADADAEAKRTAKAASLAKAKETREANKAAKALEAAAAEAALPDSDSDEEEDAPVAAAPAAAASAVAEEAEEEEEEEDEEEDEEAEVELKEWTAPLELRKGNGIETFLSAEVDGKTYLFEKGSREYIGLYMAKVKKINTKSVNPLA
jgi:hypothetical protein